MISALENLSFCMKKAFTWAEENKIDHSKILDHALAPDMLSFPKQIIIATNSAKFVLTRVAGLEVPTWEDNEKTLDDLQARLGKAIKLLRSVDATAFAGKEEKEILFKAGSREINATGTAYIQYYAIPNFFFHIVTAYDIMRNAGAPLGKSDYLAGGRSGDQTQPTVLR